MAEKEFVSQIIDLEKTCDILLQADNWTILTHHYPDGDTIGSAYALGEGLQQLGKSVQVICSDIISDKYAFLTDVVKWDEFTPEHLCAVDVADPHLLGDGLLSYAPRVELCIDHHATNTHYAQNLLYKNYAATAMIVFEILKKLNVQFTKSIAEALYTGIATDTGCFRYNNTDSLAHRMAADLLDMSIDMNHINRQMFDLKSRSRIKLEQSVLKAIQYKWNGRCAVMPVTNEALKKANVAENDTEGLASIPRQIEGVWVGITMREIDGNRFKTSIRTGPEVDASNIANLLEGGGHSGAAGCTIEGPLEHAVEVMFDAVLKAVPDIEKGL